MRKVLLITCMFFLQLSVWAQDYLTGKISSDNSGDQQIFYDRTQNVIQKNLLQSVYKIFDRDKRLIYTVYLTNDRIKSSLLLTIKPAGYASSASTITYERSQSGLIFSEQGNLDTSISLSKSYAYLLSFTDTIRDYPVLHKLRMPDGKDVALDPVSKLRLRKHKDLVRYIMMNDPAYKKQEETKELKSKKEKELFQANLLRLRDSLYGRSALFAVRVAKIRAGIDEDIARLFKTKKVYDDARRYEGDKQKGEANGNGLFMSNGNYYSGFFRDGKFVSGAVLIHYDAFEYCGDYSFDSLNGVGRVKYKNESYLLGIFREGLLVDGISYTISKTGEVFFGTVKNGLRTGYGELYNTKGEMYYGEFLNGQLVRGYSKDADPFGFFMYSRIENGIKTSVTVEEGEEFFNPLMSVKQ